MPVFKQYTESSYKWGIWKASESLEELLALLPHKENPRTFVRFFVFCHRLRLLYCFSVLYLLLCHLSFAFNVIFSIAGFSVNFSVHTISNISLRSLTLIIETI